MRRSVFRFTLLATLLAFPASAGATFPGDNGRIVFDIGASHLGSVSPAGGVADPLFLGNDNAMGGDPSIARDGKTVLFAYAPTDIQDGNTVYTIAKADIDSGSESNFTNLGVIGEQPEATPDGRILYATEDGSDNFQIHLMKSDGSTDQQLTSHAGDATDPIPSADGSAVYYSLETYTNTEGWKRGLYRRNISGGAPTAIVGPGDYKTKPVDISPDGNELLYIDNATLRARNLTTGFSRVVRSNYMWWTGARYSPDGTKIILTVEGGDHQEAVIVDVDGTNPKPLVITNTDTSFSEFAWTTGAPGLIVNDNGDGADTDDEDGLCDGDEDPGRQCTLRAALEEAGAQAKEQTIRFDLGGNGTPTISPGDPLPPVPDDITVDGTSQPGDPAAANGKAEVVLDGTNAGADAIGLELEGDDATVKGLKVTKFDGPGIKTTGTNATVVANALTENGSGVEIAGTSSTVGGAADDDANAIWKNGLTDEEAEQSTGDLGDDPTDAQIRAALVELGAGILMTSDDAKSPVIEGNAIGFPPTGSLELQSSIGVLVAPVDGDPSGAIVRDNDITGNVFGVLALPVSGAFGDPAPMQLLKNRIGKAPTGRSFEQLGAVFGVMAIRSPGVVVGKAGEGNTIQNTVGGVVALGEGGIEVRGNTIGTGEAIGASRKNELATSTSKRPALDGLNVFGVLLAENTGARVGAAGTGGNQIGPCLVCVMIGGATSSGNDVSGNTIGVASPAGDPDPKDFDDIGAALGVLVAGGLDNTVGLLAPNTVRGAGIGAMMQTTQGLGVYDTTFDETIVGALAVNTDDLEFGRAGDGNEVTDSFVGLLLTGWEPTEKELAAAGISKAEWDAFDRDLAFKLPSSEALLDVINAVEPDASVEQAVALNPAPVTTSRRRGRAGDGIFGADDLSVTANRFGRTAAGAERDNVVSAWMVGDVRDVDVRDNTIAHGRAGGLWLGPSHSGHDVERVRLLGNRIFDNYSVGSPVLLGIQGLGIDLLERKAPEVYEDSFGPTAADPGDADTGPNGFQNHPVVTSATRTGSQLRVQGVASGEPSTALTLELFANDRCNPFGFGEGQRPIAPTAQVTTGADGTAPFDVTVTAPAGSNAHVTATATGPEGTSELSACAAIVDGPAPPPVDPGTNPPAPPAGNGGGGTPPPTPPGPGPKPPSTGPTAAEQAADMAEEAQPTTSGDVSVSGTTTTGGTATFTGTSGGASGSAVAAASVRVFRLQRTLKPGKFRITLKPTAKAKRLLKRRKRLKVTLTVAFKPTGSRTTATARRTMTLRYRTKP